MKKLLAVFLTLCLLSATAQAAEESVPARWMFDSDSAYQAALADWAAEHPAQESIESAGAEHGDPAPDRLDADPADDKYPVGSYIDADGRVWSSSGKLLTPDPVPPPAAVEALEAPSDGLGDTADPADQALNAPAVSIPETLSQRPWAVRPTNISWRPSLPVPPEWTMNGWQACFCLASCSSA